MSGSPLYQFTSPDDDLAVLIESSPRPAIPPQNCRALETRDGERSQELPTPRRLRDVSNHPAVAARGNSEEAASVAALHPSADASVDPTNGTSLSASHYRI